MIKANELRIGNYIGKNGWPGHLIVTSIQSRKNNAYITVAVLDGRQSFFRVDSFNPIPLTEKWLLDFGLEETKKNRYLLDDDYDVVFDGENYYFRIGTYMDNPPSVKIKHVHQLQNLYFAPTGKELTLKP